MAKPILYKTHTFEIPCHHRLVSNTLSHEQNQQVFSKCYGNYGHGHNYKLKITFRYPYSQEEPLADQKWTAIIEEMLVAPCSYQSLNVVFANWGIKNPITTGEQILEVFAQKLEQSSIQKVLFEAELVETRKNSFYYSFQKTRRAHGNLGLS